MDTEHLTGRSIAKATGKGVEVSLEREWGIVSSVSEGLVWPSPDRPALCELIDHGGDAVCIIDREGRYLYANLAAAALVGRGPDELVGDTVTAVFGPEQARALREGAERMVIEGKVVSSVVRLGVPVDRWVARTQGPYRDRRGQLAGLLVVARPLFHAGGERAELVTRMRTLEERVRDREETLSVASHELSSPLAALRLQTDLLLRMARRTQAEPCPPWVVERLAKLDAQVQRLCGQVSTLWTFAQGRSGKLELCVGQVDLCAVAKAVVTRHAEQAAQAGCALRLVAPAAVVGEWDPVRLEQVLTNLLSNALKFGEGAPVELRLEEGEGSARVIVRDGGPGIDPSVRDRLFQSFVRGPRERRRPGLGLGLWIVKAIVEAHGGEISVQSPPGQGATFTVVLPRAKA